MRRTFGICLAAAGISLALTLPALAQESPELPAKPLTEAQPVTGEELRFYKGKGPGRGNSYVERYEEDYSYLRDPNLSTDPWFDPLKFIPFDPNGDVFLTLNGETRFRYDYTDHRNLGIATAAVPPAKPGAKPVLTPETQAGPNELYKQRYALGGDLHLGENLRFYADLYHGQQTGHDVGPSVPGSQRDELGLVNGFGEVYGIVDDAKTGFRAGRQEIFFGNDLQVRANVSTNLPSPVFDGFRAYRDWGPARVDVFAYNLVNFANDILQDKDNAHVNLWGVYTSYDLPKSEWLSSIGGDNRASVDLFYFGWRGSPNASAKGAGFYNDRALLTGGKITAATGAGFVSSQDHRYTVGLRAYGEVGNFDYDWQAAYQTGSYAGFTVAAFAFNTDTGYTFHDTPWKPRISTHVDGASGGASSSSGVLQTYQPMYPNTQYYVPNNEFAPTNFYDIAPRVRIEPLPTVSAEYYYAFLWRYSEGDAIYTGAPWPGAQGQNTYAVTVLFPGRPIGQQSDLRINWTIAPHLLFLGEFGVFFPGSALRAAGGRITTFLDANLTFRF